MSSLGVRIVLGVRAALAVAAVAALCSGCSVFEVAGRAYRGAGQAMTEYAKEKGSEGGIVAQVADVGGRVSTSVGGVLVDASQEKRDGSAAPQHDARPTTAIVGNGAPAQPAPAARPAPSAVMSIADAQRRLGELGYQAGPADGAMGPRTTEALRRFQQSVGLPATGRLDAATSEALGRAKR